MNLAVTRGTPAQMSRQAPGAGACLPGAIGQPRTCDRRHARRGTADEEPAVVAGYAGEGDLLERGCIIDPRRSSPRSRAGPEGRARR